MILEELWESLREAKIRKRAAMEKLKMAMEELAAAEARMDQALGLLPDLEGTPAMQQWQDWLDGGLLKGVFRAGW